MIRSFVEKELSEKSSKLSFQKRAKKRDPSSAQPVCQFVQFIRCLAAAAAATLCLVCKTGVEPG